MPDIDLVTLAATLGHGKAGSLQRAPATPGLGAADGTHSVWQKESECWGPTKLLT
jgi:hypothetical protein